MVVVSDLGGLGGGLVGWVVWLCFCFFLCTFKIFFFMLTQKTPFFNLGVAFV